MQFSHFGVLYDGNQSKASLFTSITLNIVIAIVVCIVGAAAKKTMDHRHKLTELSIQPLPKEVEPIKPKIIPKPLPPVPVVKVEPPKIKMPEIKLPDPPKLPEVKMTQPVPIVPPAPPKLVVALGQSTNPIAPSNRPATSAINLGQAGMAGMPSSNTGSGPRATSVTLGSGSPNSQTMAGNGTKPVQGIKLGVTGGTGPTTSTSHTVSLGQAVPPPMPKPTAPAAQTAKAPKVLFKPKPEYTAEAIRLHIEGTVSVRLRVSSSGSVQVLGVTSDLGHGLGDSAIRAVQSTRFSPATDASGNPVDWEGVVNVAFQLAG
jgi:TonB family protein